MPDRDAPYWPAGLELGVAERALAGERRSGDRAVLVAYEGGALVAAIDGLGHGGDAADAAAAAAEVLSAHPDEDPEHLIEACHEALARTRGAVMTLAWFDLESGRLSWTGVGNVEGRLVHAGAGYGAPTEGALTRGGVVGYNLPSIRVTSAELAAGDVMVLATDGIDSRLRGGDRRGRHGPGRRRPDPRRARQGRPTTPSSSSCATCRGDDRRPDGPARRRGRRGGGRARGAAAGRGVRALGRRGPARRDRGLGDRDATPSSTRAAGEVELAPAERGGRRGLQVTVRDARPGDRGRRRRAARRRLDAAARSASGCRARGG